MHVQKCGPPYGYFLRNRTTNTIDPATIVEIKATIALAFQSIQEICQNAAACSEFLFYLCSDLLL